jgi:NADP-dependent 3-hydroxy acid dehydrogenase YdfG
VIGPFVIVKEKQAGRETNMQNSSGIEDKVVVITGASSGIGEATALLLAKRGAKVVLGARGSDRLEAVAARIEDAGGEAVYAPTDVRRRDDLSSLVKLACERYGKLDVLVNGRGVARLPQTGLRAFRQHRFYSWT